jgi:hypothetical protein
MLYVSQGATNRNIEYVGDKVEDVRNNTSGLYDELHDTQTAVDGVQSSIDNVCQAVDEPLC